MKPHNRRSFLKTGAALGAAATGLSAAPAAAAPRNVLSADRMGVLVDTTVCIGCRQCEWACGTAHDLPTPPLESYEDPAPFAAMRRPDETALTVVNRYDNPKAPEVPTTVKVQCMHCDHPACVSACILGALSKEENGAVIWETDKKAWVYVQEAADRFERRAIGAATAVGADWFETRLEAGNRVVVNGAQLLLSEEFRGQITNENED